MHQLQAHPDDVAAALAELAAAHDEVPRLDGGLREKLDALAEDGVVHRLEDASQARVSFARYRNRQSVYQFSELGYRAFSAVEDVLSTRIRDANLSRLVFSDILDDLKALAAAAQQQVPDEEFLKGAIGFMDNAHHAGKPFFVWFNSTRMHIYTHLKPESKGKTGYGVYADGMVEHDGHVGDLLAELKSLGIENNTIVIYTTDNGAEILMWPDAGMTPFHGEKNTTWDGGFRVPMMVEWPGHIKPGTVSNNIISLLDWVPTLMAAAGQPDIKDELLKGYSAAGRTYKVHLDGYNQLPMLQGEGPSARKEFFYFTDDGSLSAFRYNDWKMIFSVQRAHGFDVWQEPYVPLRVPMLLNLRMDPFERAEESVDYARWRIDNLWVMVPAQVLIAQFLQTFKEFPPRAKPGSFNLDQVMQKMLQAGAND